MVKPPEPPDPSGPAKESADDKYLRQAEDAVAGLQGLLELARGALADIAYSDDMTWEVAQRKAGRMYHLLRGTQEE